MYLERGDDDTEIPSFRSVGRSSDFDPDVHFVVLLFDVEAIALAEADCQLNVVLSLAHIFAVLSFEIEKNI